VQTFSDARGIDAFRAIARIHGGSRTGVLNGSMNKNSSSLESMSRIAALPDSELLDRIARLASDERSATAALVAHLAEMDRRRLHLGQGYASLFNYCTQALHLSEHAAYNRIEAARAVRRFPVILKGLEEGRLHLAAVRALAPVLTEANHETVLNEAWHKSKREVEAIVAREKPLPPVPSIVRRIPSPAGASTEGAAVPSATPSSVASSVTSSMPSSVESLASSEPLSMPPSVPSSVPSSVPPSVPPSVPLSVASSVAS